MAPVLCSPVSARAASQPSHNKSSNAEHAGGSELARVPPIPVVGPPRCPGGWAHSGLLRSLLCACGLSATCGGGASYPEGARGSGPDAARHSGPALAVDARP
eukprot:6661263-Alexandrium_andersonii.AAC.1